MNLFDAIFRPGRSLERCAILYEQRQITYADLRAETLSLGRLLTSLKIERGDRVALLLNDSPEFVAGFIAVCSYGAIAVPINMALRLEEQCAILNDCTATVAFVEAEMLARLAAGVPAELPHLRQVVVVDRKKDGEADDEINDVEQEGSVTIWSFARLMMQAKTDDRESAIQPANTIFVGPGENQPSFILYTSGSTGEPKGALHRQSDIFYTNETYCREVLRLKDDDRLFSSSRLPFAYGLGNAFTFPLLNGCTTILCREKPSAEIIARIFADYRPTIFFGVPVVYRLLLDEARKHDDGSQLDCSSLRLCLSAGEALPAQLGEEWEKTFGVPVIDGIGSTEMLHMWMSNHEGEVVYGSSGKLLHGYDARLLDPEGNLTPAGTEGNLWVKGASAALGYWQRPETTAATFVDGWVRTGDLYRQDAAGFWFHMGRSDDCFKSSGRWVSPVEVEGLLLRLEGVSRVAVVEDFDADGLPCACAFVVRTETTLANDENDAAARELEAGLREFARASLPRFKQPRRYVFVDELPYTATGKIQRFKLRERLKDSPKSNVQNPKS